MVKTPITLQEYMEARDSLFAAFKSKPTIQQQFRVTRYCSLPVNDGGKRNDITLRPNDVVIVYSVGDEITRIRVVSSRHPSIIDDRFHRFWSHEKMAKWLDRSCEVIDHPQDEEDLHNTSGLQAEEW